MRKLQAWPGFLTPVFPQKSSKQPAFQAWRGVGPSQDCTPLPVLETTGLPGAAGSGHLPGSYPTPS
ncbi:hypothetical protein IscW_ISCW009235 [Ixodes scapularis]|uniref:Uncharacterized protein n=1 Tax=Ixodes scapularis TaxID=6945 RepID=B7PX66_IXOSC|nr:hypothetical protein IscW_ISCW009235 [Ixodes scapularis]|eukprot:XP_002399490.1 hypothetical protein IscW_ISCW009235 [Ixodes scapularis]